MFGLVFFKKLKKDIGNCIYTLFISDKKFKYLIWGIFFTNLIIGFWLIITGSLGINTDRARDFIFIDQISAGKFTLIGPRASAIDNFYHGPVWWYISSVAYMLVGGNVEWMGYFWILIIVLFLVSNWLIWQKLLGRSKTLVLLTLYAVTMNWDLARLYNPDIAGLLLPFLVWGLYRYEKEKKFWQILLVYLLLGLVIQLQIAVGAPLLLTVLVWHVYKMSKNHPKKHLIAIVMIPLILSTYILYDLRHDWQLTRALIIHFTHPKLVIIPSWVETINQRLRVGLLDAFRPVAFLGEYNIIFTVTFFVGLYRFLTNNDKNKQVQISILRIGLLLIGGFLLVSLLHRGWILTHYYSPLVTIYALMIILVLPLGEMNWRKWAIVMLLVFTILNFSFTYTYQKTACSDIDNWCFQKKIVENISSIPEKNVGVFVFSPDLLGYQQKWALTYAKKLYRPDIAIFEKKPTTYVLIAPIPKDRPDLNAGYWIKNNLGIKSKAISSIEIGGGYALLRYNLDEKDFATISTETTENWLHYR